MTEPTSQTPEEGILWRGWEDATFEFIKQKDKPILLFVADPDPTVAPFLKAVLGAMPADAKLRALLRDVFPAVLVETKAMPEYLAALGAGTAYHIAVLSPAGLTPLITLDPRGGKPQEVVAQLVRILEKLRDY